MTRTRVALCVILLAATACNSREPISQQLASRLKSLMELGKDEMSPEVVQQALDRQLRVAPVPSTGGRNKANPV
ncbi:MAG TPA: hypothetical protein VFG76_11035, partial [Candidatus Polarisedimenticolia bacterium]|nr:hypothetical protein [Candidatus Polarisedimenticolia bacterium]